MKKVILILIFNLVFADELQTLFQEIFAEIVQKPVIKVYTLPKYSKFFDNKNFLLVNNCKNADIVFGNIKCKNKPVFGLSYRFYKNYSNAFGAFYYRKGRPQLKFRKKTFLKFFKHIPKDLQKFVE